MFCILLALWYVRYLLFLNRMGFSSFLLLFSSKKCDYIGHMKQYSISIQKNRQFILLRCIFMDYINKISLRSIQFFLSQFNWVFIIETTTKQCLYLCLISSRPLCSLLAWSYCRPCHYSNTNTPFYINAQIFRAYFHFV